MVLREDFEKQGNRLFRRRSYVPLIILPALLMALRDSEFLEKTAGETTQFCWEMFFVSGLVFYLVLRTLRIKTKILHVEGR